MKLIIFSENMKITGLLLIALFSLSRAQLDDQNQFCELRLDKYDRAAMYSRNFIVGQSTRWPDAEVPYKINSAFTSSDVEKIKRAMTVIEESSCIKFVQHTDQKPYLNIFTGGRGCYANLGYNPWRSTVSLHLQQDSYCMVVGTIVHEMLHALGFAHEHTRPDRDDYVKVNWGKIPRGYTFNWVRAGGENESPLPPVCDTDDGSQSYDDCYAGFQASTFGVPYDYGSVMHYNLRAGSPDGSAVMEALKPIPSGVSIGQRSGPSDLDFEKLNKAYSCEKKVTTPKPTTPKPTTPKPATTTKPTTTEKPCDDLSRYCPGLKADCPYDPRIHRICKKTCGICDGITPTIPDCKDKYDSCGSWKRWCKYSVAVKQICPESCGLC